MSEWWLQVVCPTCGSDEIRYAKYGFPALGIEKDGYCCDNCQSVWEYEAEDEERDE